MTVNQILRPFNRASCLSTFKNPDCFVRIFRLDQNVDSLHSDQ